MRVPRIQVRADTHPRSFAVLLSGGVLTALAVLAAGGALLATRAAVEVPVSAVARATAEYVAEHVPVPAHLTPILPATAEMSGRRLADIGMLVQRGIDAGGYPGGAVVVGRRGGAVLEKGFGRTDWASASLVDPDSTMYDLASLTKVVATTSAIMALYDDGVVTLDDPVSRWVPAFRGGVKDRVTVRDLLTHRSGLPAGRDLWRFRGDPAAARAAVVATPLVAGCPPGKCYIYSDLGADLLGFVAETAAGEPLDRFVGERVFAPLGMTQTTFRPRAEQLGRLARTGAPPGRVHDGNAAALGGVAGHAGLFSTAGDLAVFAQMLLGGGMYDGVRVFADSTVQRFTTRAAGTRALGWDTCDVSDPRSTCGRYVSPGTFGHLGFTGTSLLVDPEREMFVILLTNRVDNPRVRRPALVIHDIRADVADAAVRAASGADAGEPPARPAFRSDRRQRWEAPLPRPRSSRAARPRRARRATRSAARSAARGAARGHVHSQTPRGRTRR